MDWFFDKKKTFLDLSFDRITKERGIEFYETEHDLKKIEEKKNFQNTEILEKLESLDLKKFPLNNMDVNFLIDWFAPKTFYSRPTGKQLQKRVSFLDYKTPLSGFIRKYDSYPQNTTSSGGDSFLFSYQKTEPFSNNTSKTTQLVKPLTKGLYLKSDSFTFEKWDPTTPLNYLSFAGKKKRCRFLPVRN